MNKTHLLINSHTSKQQQTAKLEEVRACIKSGTYVVKVNDSAKKSEAYDLIQIITDKAGNQIHCFYFCTSCANDSKDPIIFADTRNGTSKILAHRRKHDKVVAVSSSAGVGTSKSTQNLGCADDCAKMKDETQQNSTSYMFDADSLSLVLSKMTSIGHDHGVLDPNAVKSLLPQADEWYVFFLYIQIYKHKHKKYFSHSLLGHWIGLINLRISRRLSTKAILMWSILKAKHPKQVLLKWDIHAMN